jgi:Ribbon-helix-helix protein, copG family
MTGKQVYGHTKAGEPVTDEMIELLADAADRGYEPGQLKGHRRGPGRPPLGEAAKSVESVRLEPALRDEAARRAEEEGITVSELIRRALRQYLKSA